MIDFAHVALASAKELRSQVSGYGDWCTSATGEDKYAEKKPLIFMGNTLTVELAAKTVQTFEVPASLPNVPLVHHPAVEQNLCMFW